MGQKEQIYWAIRMRATKSAEGQCHEHKKKCDETKKFHSNLYEEWIDVVEEVYKRTKIF